MLTVELITGITAIVSSLVAEYIPKWDAWPYKKVTLLTFNLLLPIIIYLVICLGKVDVGLNVECGNVVKYIVLGIAAALGNQGTFYLLTGPKVAVPNRGSDMGGLIPKT